MGCPTLKSRWQFDLVYSQGRKRACRALVLFYLARPEEEGVAYVASRKVGDAVARNRAKRLMREAFKKARPSLPVSGGWLILVARREITQLKSGQVAMDLQSLLAGIDG
jgi:ribonuclease P protein component